MQNMTQADGEVYKTLVCKTGAHFVAELQLARPDKSNALNSESWRELPQAGSAALQTDRGCKQSLVFIHAVDISLLQVVRRLNDTDEVRVVRQALHTLCSS